MQAGAIIPLVGTLRQHPYAVLAELAAAVLCNLSVQSPVNRQAILSVGGLEPLLAMLSSGQDILTHHVPCEVRCHGSFSRTWHSLWLCSMPSQWWL